MTRAQRRAHAIVLPLLAIALFASIGFAFVRRSVTSRVEAAPLGHVAP